MLVVRLAVSTSSFRTCLSQWDAFRSGNAISSFCRTSHYATPLSPTLFSTLNNTRICYCSMFFLSTLYQSIIHRHLPKKSIMVADHFRIIADFCTPYKGNDFHNNTDESVNLESLRTHIHANSWFVVRCVSTHARGIYVGSYLGSLQYKYCRSTKLEAKV